MSIYDNTEWKDLPWFTIMRYKKIYNFVFKYLFFLFIIVISIIIFIPLSKNTIALNRVDKYPKERAKLLSEINKGKWDLNYSDIETKIIQWELSKDETLWEVFSINNLIKYKWFVMPRVLHLKLDNNLKNKNYYTSWYEISNLEEFITNIIFTDYKETLETNQDKLLPLTDDSISNTFFVSCLESNPNWLCKQFISNFINTFYVYNLSTDYAGLNKVFNEIKSTEYSYDFCKWIMKFVSYTHDVSADIEWIMSQCWWPLYEEFLSIKSFFGIQQQLSNWYIKSNLSSDPDVNAYKLISYQQILYNNVSEWIINEANFTTYLNYISALLKKDKSIDPIYYDITYWIDNVFLIPNLNLKKYKLTDNKRNELDWIINDIYAMNYGSKLEWHFWLESKITNRELTKLWATSIADTIIAHEQNEMTQLLKNLKWLSYLRVTDEDIKWNIIRINWYLSIIWLDEPLFISANFENKNGKLIVNKIWITEYNNLAESLNTLLSQQDYSFVDVYEYINKSIKIYSSANLSTPCEIISSKIEWIWTITDCDSDKVLIRRDDWISFKFIMKNYNLQSVTISDKELQKTISNYISWIYTNDVTIPKIISNILSYRESTNENPTEEASLNMITALQTITQYLWAEITNIQEQWDGIIYLEFTLGNINFSGLFNVDTDILYSLSFLDKGIKIRKMELILNNSNVNEINNFKAEPLKYIEKYDKSAVTQYQS
jgi:hypothetical protein